jgi:hypothetical protein
MEGFLLCQTSVKFYFIIITETRASLIVLVVIVIDVNLHNMLFQNYRKFEANATTSGNTTDPNTDQTFQAQATESTQKVETDAERNFAAMRRQNEKLTKDLETYRKASEEAETLKLQSEKKWEDLYKLEQAKAKANEDKLTAQSRQNQIQKDLLKSGLSSDLAELLLPSITSKLEYDEKGNATNLQSVIDELPKQLFAPLPPQKMGSSGVSATTNPGTGMSVEEATRILQSPNVQDAIDNQAAIEQALNIKL